MTANFDRLARPYLWMERLAFGRDLERARFCHLDSLKGRERILILGEGDGRFLAELLRRFPSARVECVDASGAMLSRAKSRLSAVAAARVLFRQEDALRATWNAGRFDAVVTLFFLDCFSPEELNVLIPNLTRAMKADAIWLWTDFVVPARGWRRARAALWLWLLYGSFRALTGLRVRRLPPSETLLEGHGFQSASARTFQAEMLKSVRFVRAPASRAGS